ncbi:MAG: hypothetical protein ACYC7I_05305 [Gammaproteobacteria bacterium]
MSISIRVLILADGDGSFTQHNHRFGLTELVDTLKADVGDGINFHVTTAHRYPAANYEQAVGADISGFRFDNAAQFSTGTYDEVWLFGFASATPAYSDPDGFQLADNEVDILAQFMDQGGGVFATGDHDDLGRDLCGKLPRVRSMRRWNFNYAALGGNAAHPDYNLYNEGSGDSPPAMGPHRHSTIVASANGRYEFDSQSDDIPQTIEPVITVTGSKHSLITQVVSFPHPLLCGLSGVIDILPDHMHEGECQVPDDLTATYVAGGVTRDEYPKFAGSPLPPQVVAWGHVKARNADPSYTDPGKSKGYDDNEPLNPDVFGDIAAWDGQVVNHGRVVVDSTFHHFVNVNVIGVGDDLNHQWNADEAIKYQGFLGSSAGQKAYGRIREYWRNIARWIAPAPLQTQFGLYWIKQAARASHLNETIASAHGLSGMLHHGAGVHTYLQKWLPPCATLEISSQGVPNPLSILLRNWFILINLPDPPPPGVDLRTLAVDIRALSRVAISVATVRTRQLLRKGGRLDTEEHLRAINAAVAPAIHELIGAQIRALEAGLHDMQKLAHGMSRQ